MFFDKKRGNNLICINVGNKPFNVLATSIIPDYHVNGDAICLSLFRHDNDGNRIDNITDWGLEQFRRKYGPGSSVESAGAGKSKRPTKKRVARKSGKEIQREDVFHYVYAVLHNPAYRKKYERNLEREFPRIPFYDDFWKWGRWGKKLMDLHINYERAKP